MAKAKEQQVESMDAQFQADLQKVGMAGLLKKVEDFVDMDVVCVSTGFPQLDEILHEDRRTEAEREGQPRNVGLPLGRDIEIFSRVPEVGKTSIALAIGKSFQQQGKRVAIIDVARTITAEYLEQLGLVINPETADENGWYVPYVMRAEDVEGNPLSCEQVFNAVQNAAKVVDLVIVDDVPSLMSQADLEKDSDENTRTGGISKQITDHMRKTTIKRAAVIWINQQRQKIGFSMPGMPPTYKSMGGEAIPFFGSIRLDLSMIEKVTVGADNNKQVIGVKVKVFTAKNKVSPPYKAVTLTYLDYEGFSPIYDYFDMGLKAKVIEKKGAWILFPGGEKVQGELKAYQLLKENGNLLETVKEALDGETVTA